MRNRSTRAIVGLLLLAGVATSGLKQAGFLTGSVVQNARMQFRAASPYATMDTNGVITVPTGSNVLLDWSEVGGSNNGSMMCYLYASRAIDGLPASKNDTITVPNYGVRQVNAVTQDTSFTLVCDNGDGYSPPLTSQTVQVRVGGSDTVLSPYDYRVIQYPGLPVSATFTLTSGSSTNGADNVLDIKSGSDVTLSWTSSGTQDACTLQASDLVNVPTEIASGTLHPGNTYGGGVLSNVANNFFIVRRTGSMTLRGVSESFSVALNCVTNIPPGGGSAAAVTMYRAVYIQPQSQCADGADNDGDGKTDFPTDPDCTNAQDNVEAALPVTLDLKVNGQDGTIAVAKNTVVNLSWTSTNATSCDTGSSVAPWGPATPKATSGSESFTVTKSMTLGIQCTEVGNINRNVQDSIGVVLSQCSDGIDNDGDGKTDFPTDPDCANAEDNDEAAAVVQCINGGYEYQLTTTTLGYDQSGPAPAGGGWTKNDNVCLMSNASAQCEVNAVLWRRASAQAKDAVLTTCANPGNGYVLKSQIAASAPIQALCLWEKDSATPVDLMLGHAGTGFPIDMNCNTTVNGPDGSVDKPTSDYVFQSRICAIPGPGGICSSDLCLFGKTLNACAASSDMSCKAAEFNAAQGTFAAQGWTEQKGANATITGPFDDAGTKYVRIADGSSTMGPNAYLPLPRNIIQDKDFAVEMKARIVASATGRTELSGGNGLFLAPDGRYIALYFDTNKFGTIKNLAWSQTVSRNTSDAFHVYKIAYKKNGAGVTDDTFDVYFDGEKVLSDVTLSSVAYIPSQSSDALTVGAISTDGTSTMDVAYVKFSNNASPCVTYNTVCGVSEFYAEDGSFESQGWTTVTDSNPDTNLTGPTTANGVTYVRLSDQSTTGGLRTSDLDITNAMLADRDWSLEMKARAVDSDPNGYVLGMNMLLVTPNEVSTSLFIDENKFGFQAATPNAYTWGSTVSRTTTDTFHTYIIKNKKNGAGVADDTIDLYFDGTKVISDVARSQFYVYDAGTGVQGISFGIGSSPGRGIMDVSHVKFKNDEASCPANPFKAVKPECSDGKDNDGDGKTDYWVQTAAVQTFGPVLLPDVYLPAPPDTPKQLRPYTLVTGLSAGQKIATGPVGGTFDNSGSPGACSGIVGPGRVYIPVDYVNDSGTVIKSEVAWDGAELTVPAGATQMRGYAPIVGSSCTLSGSVYDAPPAFDPDCTSASDDSESSGTCTDSDGGNTPLTKGFVNASAGTLKTASDTCDATGKLTEYFCDTDKTIKSSIATCEPGFTCTDGACKASAVSSVAPNPARVGFGGVAFDGNDVIFMPLQNGDMTYHGNVLSFGPVCKPGECGDGVLTSDEQCDDGNTESGDGCNSKCIWEPYATAFTSSSSSVSSSSSSSSSSFVARCGDRVITAPEKCDDGNAIGGDGCSAFCQIETGWQCTPRLP